MMSNWYECMLFKRTLNSLFRYLVYSVPHITQWMLTRRFFNVRVASDIQTEHWEAALDHYNMLAYILYCILILSTTIYSRFLIRLISWSNHCYCNEMSVKPFNRQIIQFEFSPTWSCVSLTRSTTSSEWKVFIFDKMAVNSFQILLVDVEIYL